MCSPVTSMMSKSEPIWAVACPGSYAFAPESYSPLTLVQPDVRAGGDLQLGDVEQPPANRAGLRHVQRFQDEQGRSVLDDTSPIALTARKGAITTNGGVSGPYPWRQPV